MSGFFDELERRLREATVERRASASGAAPGGSPSPPPRRGWARRHRRMLVVTVVALAGVAVPSVAAVTDLWRPDVDSPPPMETMTATPGPAAACRHTSTRPLDVGPPVGPEFTSVLGVLARPRTAADAYERKYLRAPGLLGVDVRGIRHLGTAPDGVRYFAVPVRGFGWHPLPDRCLRKLSPRMRRLVAPRAQQREPAVCVYGGNGGTCSSLADIRAHGTFGSSGTMRSRATVAGIVPNGVDRVRVTYGSSVRTFPVSDNFFSFRVALGAPQALTAARVE